MKQQTKESPRDPQEPKLPGVTDTSKEVQREKAEVKEVAGRHKNDGQLNHKGRQ